MTRWSIGRVSWTAIALCVVPLVSCSDGSERFFIVQNQVPNAGCEIPASRSDLYRGRGTLDVSLVSAGAAAGYRLYPLMQNDLPALGQTGGTEPNRLSLSEFRVRLELEAGAPQAVADLFSSGAMNAYLAYSEPWSGTVDPGGGLLSAGVTVVPAELARQIRSTRALETLSHFNLTAQVRAVGSTLDTTMESREFAYPIRICQGCLVQAVLACPYAPANPGDPCNVAQDTPVDCCTEGDALHCPARPAAQTR